jgi:hypothetical protein
VNELINKYSQEDQSDRKLRKERIGRLRRNERKHVSTTTTVKLGMVVHACNPSNWEVEAGEDCEFKASLDYKVRPCLKKLLKTNQNLSNNKTNPTMTTVSTALSHHPTESTSIPTLKMTIPGSGNLSDSLKADDWLE